MKQRSCNVVMLTLFGALAWCCPPLQGAPAAGGPARISEVRIDQLGSDSDEYFEITGPPAASLSGLTYVVIGDSSAGGSGVVEVAVDLSAGVIRPAGYWVAAESTFSLGMADLVTELNFENGDNVTHLLVEGFSGALGDDLDTDDDCVLDATPWLAVLDQVVLLHSTAAPPAGSDCHYGLPVVGPVNGAVPPHVYRCFDDPDRWEAGSDDPASGFDTPGADNPGCAGGCNCIDEIAPALDHAAMLAGGHLASEPVVHSGYVDPRWESGDGIDMNRGLDRLTLVFTEPVFDIGGCPKSLLTPAAFEVRTTGGATPVVLAVETADHIHVTVRLDRIIPLQEWTTVVAHVEDQCGNLIPSGGDQGPGALESDRIDVAFLPGDIDQSGTVQNLDLLRFHQYVQQELVAGGVCITCPHHDIGGEAVDYYDIDRSGVIDPLDALRYRQLLSGSGAATRPWGSPPNHTLSSPQP